MIQSKEDLKFYIKCDEIARFGKEVSFKTKLRKGVMWKFNVVLRKLEYNENCRKGIAKKIARIFLKLKKKSLENKTDWYIAENSFGPGLCISHKGIAIVNSNAKFGSNVRINAMVNVGASGGDDKAPVFGDNIYIGPGAKIFGDIKLGSNIAIGANAVVNKSFDESNVTIAGIPAKVISNHGCENMVIDAVKIASEK